MDLISPADISLQYLVEPPTITMQEEENKFPILVEAMMRKESDCDVNAIGDKHLANKAYGCLQIRQPAMDDINRRFGTNYKAEDTLGNKELSIWTFYRYMEIYATEARLGRPVTDEDRARIWNGGPNGYKRRQTVAYWRDLHNRILDVRAELKEKTG